MSVYTPNRELRQLVDRMLEGSTLSRTEIARVEELCDDPEALNFYLAMTTQEALLPEALAQPVRTARAKSRAFAFPTREVLKIAAVCAFAFGIGWLVRSSSETMRPVPAEG